MMKEHPRRERLDAPKGDDVIVPAKFYTLRDRKRPLDKFDQMYFDRVRRGQIDPKSPGPRNADWNKLK